MATKQINPQAIEHPLTPDMGRAAVQIGCDLGSAISSTTVDVCPVPEDASELQISKLAIAMDTRSRSFLFLEPAHPE